MLLYLQVPISMSVPGPALNSITTNSQSQHSTKQPWTAVIRNFDYCSLSLESIQIIPNSPLSFPFLWFPIINGRIRKLFNAPRQGEKRGVFLLSSHLLLRVVDNGSGGFSMLSIGAAFQLPQRTSKRHTYIVFQPHAPCMLHM